MIEKDRLLKEFQLEGEKNIPSLEVALLRAAVQGRPHDLEILIKEFGAKINTRDEQKRTPLHLAVMAENVPNAFTLIALGADLNFVDIDGYTPGVIAENINNKELNKLFLNKPKIESNLLINGVIKLIVLTPAGTDNFYFAENITVSKLKNFLDKKYPKEWLSEINLHNVNGLNDEELFFEKEASSEKTPQSFLVEKSKQPVLRPDKILHLAIKPRRERRTTFNDLPPEIRNKILSFLPIKSILKMAHVSKELYACIMFNFVFWNQFLKPEYRENKPEQFLVFAAEPKKRLFGKPQSGFYCVYEVAEKLRRNCHPHLKNLIEKGYLTLDDALWKLSKIERENLCNLDFSELIEANVISLEDAKRWDGKKFKNVLENKWIQELIKKGYLTIDAVMKLSPKEIESLSHLHIVELVTANLLPFEEAKVLSYKQIIDLDIMYHKIIEQKFLERDLLEKYYPDYSFQKELIIRLEQKDILLSDMVCLKRCYLNCPNVLWKDSECNDTELAEEVDEKSSTFFHGLGPQNSFLLKILYELVGENQTTIGSFVLEVGPHHITIDGDSQKELSLTSKEFQYDIKTDIIFPDETNDYKVQYVLDVTTKKIDLKNEKVKKLGS